MRHLDFFNTFVNPCTVEETLQEIVTALQEGRRIVQSSMNVAILVEIQNNMLLREAVNASDINSADGMGVIWGAKLLGISIPERVTGIDLMEKLVDYASQNHLKVYFLGAAPDVVPLTVARLQERYPDLLVAGYYSGFYTKEEEKQIVQEIAASCADILFVAMGCPRQELFIHRNRASLNVAFAMPVGGSFDVMAGKFKRAPLWMQKRGLEWLFRLIQEPRRLLKRFVMTNMVFFLMILMARFKMLFGKAH